MLRQIIFKELLDTFLSVRFAVIFGACSFLVLFSIFTGTQEYLRSARQYQASTSVMRDTVAKQVSYQALGLWGAYKVYKKPAALSSLVQGVEGNLGRSSVVSIFEAPKLSGTRYNDEPIYAMFGTLDLFFIANLVLSLFALVFTFDAISGERESGTLKLVLANAIPRDSVVLGKLIGNFIGLVLPLLIPVLLGVLLMSLVPEIDLQGGDWARLALLLVLTLVYVSFFLGLGVFVSSRAQRSSISFLVLLVTWVLMVWVVPRAGVMLSATVVPVPELAEVEAAKGAVDRQWYRESQGEQERWLRENPQTTVVPDEVQGSINGRLERKAAEEKRRIDEDFMSHQRRRRSVAMWLARVSPASCFAHAAMGLALSDIERQERFLSAINEHRRQFQVYVSGKMQEERRAQALGRVSNVNGIDVSGMPLFEFAEEGVGQTVERVWPDFALLGVMSLLAFVAAYFSFLRYEVR